MHALYPVCIQFYALTHTHPRSCDDTGDCSNFSDGWLSAIRRALFVSRYSVCLFVYGTNAAQALPNFFPLCPCLMCDRRSCPVLHVSVPMLVLVFALLLVSVCLCALQALDRTPGVELVLMSTSQLLPTLAKLLVFDLHIFFDLSHIFSNVKHDGWTMYLGYVCVCVCVSVCVCLC